MPEPKFPVTLVHPDLKDAEITAASRTSLRAHKARGWVEKKTDDTSTSTKSTSSTAKKTS